MSPSSSQLDLTRLSRVAADLAVLFSTLDGCKVTGIAVSASSLEWSGALFAPNSEVHVRASVMRTTNGAVVGGTVLLEASKVEIGIKGPREVVRLALRRRSPELMGTDGADRRQAVTAPKAIAATSS